MIAKIAVAAANFAIDKPYSYVIPKEMTLQPGMRVHVPFGRSNRPTEGVVLCVEEGDVDGLKPEKECLDDTPALNETMLRLAAFLRERYFCTFYDAARAILPAGLWFQTKDTYALTDDRSWQEKKLRTTGATEILQTLADCGGQADEQVLRNAVSSEEVFEKALHYLLSKKWICGQRAYLRRTGDKTEKIATLVSSVEETMEYATSRPKSALMQRAVLELCALWAALR